MLVSGKWKCVNVSVMSKSSYDEFMKDGSKYEESVSIFGVVKGVHRD